MNKALEKKKMAVLRAIEAVFVKLDTLPVSVRRDFADDLLFIVKDFRKRAGREAKDHGPPKPLRKTTVRAEVRKVEIGPRTLTARIVVWAVVKGLGLSDGCRLHCDRRSPAPDGDMRFRIKVEMVETEQVHGLMTDACEELKRLGFKVRNSKVEIWGGGSKKYSNALFYV